MRDQLIQYVRLLFAGTPDSYDMQQEILQNTLDRYDDLIAQGKSPEAAYRLAISGIGDINEIIGNTQSQHSPAPAPVQEQQDEPQDISKKEADAGYLHRTVYLLCDSCACAGQYRQRCSGRLSDVCDDRRRYGADGSVLRQQGRSRRKRGR